MKNFILLKQGLTNRINVLNAKAVMAAAQKNYLEAIDFNNRKVQLLLELEAVIMREADESGYLLK